MARYLYAATPSDYVVNTATGLPVPGAVVTVWTARTGGTQITDLQNLAGTPVSQVTADAQGLIAFYGPDARTDNVWLNTGAGNRLLARVVEDFALKSSVTSLESSVSSLSSDLSGKVDKSVFQAAGDLLVGTGTATSVRLPKGTDGKILGVASGSVGWVDPTSTAVNVTAGMDVAVGTVMMWLTGTLPADWLVCDGSAVSRTTYADLFAQWGTSFGAGDGSTTFNLPNWQGKFVVGQDGGDPSFGSVGATGGAKNASISTSNLPSHTHTVVHTHPVSKPSSSGTQYVQGSGGTPLDTVVTENTSAISPSTTGSTGSGTPISTLPPYFVAKYIVKARQLVANPSAARPWPVWKLTARNALTSSTGLTAPSGTWAYNSDGATTASALGTLKISPAPVPVGWGGVAAEVDFKAEVPTTGSVMGLSLYWPDVSTYWLHMILTYTSSTVVNADLYEGTASTLVTNLIADAPVAQGISTNGWYTMRVTAAAGRLGFAFGQRGSTLANVFSSGFVPGDVTQASPPEFQIWTQGGSSHARFGDLRIWSLQDGLPASTPSWMVAG